MTGRITGGMHNLHFQHGIYIAGHGGLEVSYLDGQLPNFRGCMEDVVFNQREILSSLRSYPGFKKVYEVSLGCSDEFFAGEDEAINFFSSRSYVTFPEWKVQRDGLLEFALQTGTQQALLLFQSGREGDFVALEIVEGFLKAHVGRDRSDTQLSSFSLVSDNQWHDIQLRFTERYLGLMVDEQRVRANLPLQSKLFVSAGPLFVGGLDRHKGEEVKRLGLASVPGKSAGGISFKGCLRGLEANSEKRALKDAFVSKDISAGCKMKGSDNENPSATTMEKLLLAEVPLSTADSEAGKPSLQDVRSYFLVLNNLEVQEGGQALLEQRHMKVDMELKDLGIHQSQILFKIKEMPVYGFLRLDVSPEQGPEKVFTLLDLEQGNVWYVHDGSEEPRDYFTFSVSSNSKREVPLYLQGHVSYVFNIVVIPVNDPPNLKLPEGNLLLVFENSKKRLTPNIIHVSDPDTDSSSLSVSVLGNFNSDAGFLENINDPGRAINGFSYGDLRDGNIFCVHRGHPNSRILLRANDGELVSSTVVLRVMAIPWDLAVANRTGVAVQQGGSVLITQSNLSVEVNGERPEVDTRYVITYPPRFGQIQQQGPGGEWKQISTFSQRSVDWSQIRYCTTFKDLQLENVMDHFKFKVDIEGKSSEELVFPITIQWLKFTLLKNVALEISKIKRHVLNSDHLQAVTEGVEVPERELHFKLLTPPKKGKLLLGTEVLQTNSVFSQQNITDGKISYEPQERPREHSQDSFRFLMVAKHTESKGYTFRINFKAERRHIIVTNRGLLVKEGEGKLITKSELFAQTLDNRTFQYTVTKSPQHGKLKLIRSSDSPGNQDNITAFMDQDILGERLIYEHDDSETQSDEFFLVASTAGPVQEGAFRDLDMEHLSMDIKVTISVELKNDEKPVRMVDKVFHVVRNGQRLLTLSDICYHDPDSDFDDGQLLYIRRGIPNGDLVQASDPTQKLYQFRQEDLREGRVLFRHRGADSARFVLFVTDGVHYTSSLLEVSVSDPYIRVVNNTGLLVQRGKDSSLTTANLSVTTNQDVRTDHEVEFRIVQLPKHGRVLVSSSAPGSFSMHDLKQGCVIYRHDGSGSFDMFNLTVRVKDTHLYVGVYVQVDSESHQHHTRILHSKTLVVEEGKPVKLSRGRLQVWVNSVAEITRDELCAVDGDSSPQDLAYLVSPPSNGHLALKSIPGRSIQNFTQAQINEGQLVFVHNGAMSGGFNFQVTDGLNFAPRQIFSITARALIISLEVNRGLSIFPGSVKPLSSRDLRAVTNDVDSAGNRTITFTVIRSPRLGRLLRVNSDNSTEDVSVFTQNLVSEQLILYQHMDWENMGWTAEDSFTFTVSSPPAALVPEEFHITISYEINEPGRQSRLLANTGAVVKEGDKVLIDQSKLDASNLLLKLPKSQRSLYEIWFQVTSLPHHGTLMVGERNITKRKPNFSQYIINTFGVTYLHDDSESLADNFTFAVWPNEKSKSTMKPEADFHEEMFNITITPINDQAPELKTKGLRLQVLQGNRFVLGPENLKVEDLDSPPEEIRYVVIRDPNNGFLAMAHHPHIPVHHFTQADIDNSQVWFIHDGSPSSGAFYFSVSDGQHRPLYKLFHLDVIPVSITLVNLTDLLLSQGQTSVTITGAHLSAVTNGRSPHVTYKVMRPLQHGHLLIEDQEVVSFGQEDLNLGKLSYHMTNLTASEDQLQFSLFTSESNLTGQTLGIRVQPLLRVSSGLTVANRVAHQLSRKDLDATELANRTNSDPTFEVTEPPVHSRLVRRAGWDTALEDATLFTQRDIDQGLLILEPHANLTGPNSLSDSFTFLLRADHVQPATGCLPFTIVPPDPFFSQTFTPNVSFLVTDNLVTIGVSQEKPVVSSEPTTQTGTLGKLTQTRWPEAAPWGRHSGEEPTLDVMASPTRVTWSPDATRASPGAPTQTRESSHPLMVIMPLSVVLFLLIVTVVASCVWLLGRKAEKATPLIKPQINLEPTTAGPRPERSPTVPTVTVTPLPRSSGSAPVSLFRAPPCERMEKSPASEPAERCAPWETWMNLDPDMVKLCRQTNPALKHKQYWV
uniref:Chondroitin sulfate proteoglycan 4-like n=1 Tax=Bos indicus x Bos taurus TaxID=30522 RepID=A0A4W2FKR1_BOBOX